MKEMQRNDNDINKFRLKPDPNDTFGSKAALKRSELLGGEGSLLDERLIAEAEGDTQNSPEQDNIYLQLKLQAGQTEQMPGKNSLKRKSGTSLILKRTLQIALPLAATLMLAWFVLNPGDDNQKAIPSPVLSAVNDTLPSKQDSTFADEEPEKQPLPVLRDTVVRQPVQALPQKVVRHNARLAEQKTGTPDTTREIYNVNKLEAIDPFIEVNQTLLADIGELQHTDILFDTGQFFIDGYGDERNSSVFGLVKSLFSSKEKRQQGIQREPWLDRVIQNRVVALNSFLGKESVIIQQYDSTGILLQTSIKSEGVEYTKSYASK